MGNLSKKIGKTKRLITIESERSYIQFISIYLIFAIISLIMTLVNIFTKSGNLTYITLAFTVLNLVNILFLYLKKHVLSVISKVLFCIETISLFTYFIISGNPDGFSAIWVALLPLVALLLYKTKNGTIISAVMFAVLVFFFWTDYGKSLLNNSSIYTDTFTMRFPIIYLACYFVGLIFEYIRSLTQTELIKARDNFQKLSLTDGLTGLGNETAYIRAVVRKEKEIENKTAKFALVIMDVNCVKVANDTYGHRFGCSLIVSAGKMLPQIFKDSEIFHLGGDEFAVILQNEDYAKIKERLEDCKNRLEYSKTSLDGIELTLSVAVGYAVYKSGETYVDTFQRADKSMYENKKAVKQKYQLQER